MNIRDDGRVRNLVLLCAIVAIGIAFMFLRQKVGHGDYLVDLRAFYCGGSVLLHHADPYTSPAVACTHAIAPGAEVLRAPHPPFALLFYSLLATMPFGVVSTGYLILAWIALGATAFVLSKLTPAPAWVLALGMTPLLGYQCISFGQPTPFIALAIVLSAYCIVAERYVAAAIFAALTFVFPQMGLPIVAALFVCKPKTRVTLGVAVAFLFALGLIALGPAANINYVTVSLKLEQLQTSGDALQFSLPWLLQQLHVAAPLAALAGTLWYVVAVAAGIVWLKRGTTAASGALVVMLPPALVALGSSFVHLQHFALGLPVALFVLCSKRQIAIPVFAGTVLLVVPWQACIVARSFVHEGARASIFIALGVAFTFCVLRFVFETTDVRPLAIRTVAVLVSYLAIVAIVHVALHGIATVDEPPNGLATLSFKLPTMLGLAIVLIYGVFQPSAASRAAVMRSAA